MSKTHTCPVLGMDMGRRCQHEKCPFHSTTARTGCWHGEEVSIKTYAQHKGMKQTQVRAYLTEADSKLKHWLAYYHFAIFCGDAEPTKEDLKLWKKMRKRKPLRLPFFGFITPERFARMRQPSAQDAFREQRDLDSSIDLAHMLGD